MIKSAPGLAAIVVIALISRAVSAQMTLDDDGSRLLVLDRGKPVIGYFYGGTAAEEAPRDTQFIYPLHGMGGDKIVGESEKLDGHSGIFWAWGNCQVGNRPMDVWEGVSARRDFERWLEQTASAERADIALQSVWLFTDTGAAQVIETTAITVWPELRNSRSIDISIYLRNVSYELLTIAGVDNAQGFCLRPALDLKKLTLSGGRGIVAEGLSSMRSPWLDISYQNPRHASYSGLAIFQHPKNPGYTGANWHFGAEGLVGASLPKAERHKLKPGEGMHFQYRLYIHRGFGPNQALEKPYADYLREINAPDNRLSSKQN